MSCVIDHCTWPVLCTCCTLLAYLIHAVCAEPVHSRCHLNCAVGNQPTLPALGWMIGRDDHALFVWHWWAPACVAAVRGFAKPLHAVGCYYATLLLALRQAAYTPCNQLMGLHPTTSVDVYLGIMWYASFCIHTDKGQVPEVLPNGLGFFHCRKGLQPQKWAATPTAQVPKLGFNIQHGFDAGVGKVQWWCGRRWSNGFAAGTCAGNGVNTQHLTPIKTARQRGRCTVWWSLRLLLYDVNYCLLPGCLQAYD